jgi:hypothetical protein
MESSMQLNNAQIFLKFQLPRECINVQQPRSSMNSPHFASTETQQNLQMMNQARTSRNNDEF